MGEKYRVMTKEDVRNYKNWTTSKVRKWHDGFKPDYILLTETSAVPLGYAIKSAWKHTYPEEKPPIFLRVDPKQLTRAMSEDNVEAQNNYSRSLKQLPHNKKTRVMVFDEEPFSKESPETVAHVIKYVFEIPDKNIRIDRGNPKTYRNKVGPVASFPDFYDPNKDYILPTIKLKSR